MKSAARISTRSLNRLLAVLDVKALALSELLVSPCCSLSMKRNDSPGIYYVLEGTGAIYIHNCAPVKILSHTLIIVPPNLSFRLEAFDYDENGSMREEIKISDSSEFSNHVLSCADEHGDPDILMIYGFFNALYGSTSDLFETLSQPIVQNFSAHDKIEAKIKIAMSEFMSQEIGASAMTSTLLKQIIVAVVRKSLASMDVWIERFFMLSDPKIAHAFAEMVAQPSKAHSIHSLAETACLSRSAFLVRFTNATGRSPMMVLRDLRMRQAATDLLTGNTSLEQVIRSTGYASSGSFSRAFKQTYGVDPSAFRKSSRDQKSV